MKIEEQLAIARQSAVGNVSVAQNEMPSSVFPGVTARPRQYIGPVIQLRIAGGASEDAEKLAARLFEQING